MECVIRYVFVVIFCAQIGVSIHMSGRPRRDKRERCMGKERAEVGGKLKTREVMPVRVAVWGRAGTLRESA